MTGNKFTDKVLSDLSKSNNSINKLYPGETNTRQPIHTLYGGAHLFKSDTITKLSSLALKSFEDNIKDEKELSEIFGWNTLPEKSKILYVKVRKKLEHEAIEDFRIDFEDGFGIRPDKEEDETAEFAAMEYVKAVKEKAVSPFFGIRIKSFSEEVKYRSVKTLNIFLRTLIEQNEGVVPENFVINLPKVTTASQVSSLSEILDNIEKYFGLKSNSLKTEIMIETPLAVFDQEGKVNMMNLITASGGRCVSVHLGLYDLTSSCGIAPEYQTYNNPLCDYVRYLMKLTLTGTGINLSDGATIVIPVGPNKSQSLTEVQRTENRKAIHRAWRIIHENVSHSLENGFYRGWDLHPGQIPARYFAVYKFFDDGYEEITGRLKNFIEKAARAAMTGSVFDDAATGTGMMNFILKGINCGAFEEKEIEKSGIDPSLIKSGSFYKLIEK